MDNAAFDRLARSLRVRGDRRLTLLLLAGLGAGGVISNSPGVSAKPCKRGKKKCGKRCIPKQDCCKDAECDGELVCRRGDCRCPGGKRLCGETCLDLRNDGANCGACGNVCDSGTCINGACNCIAEADCPEECTCFALQDVAAVCGVAAGDKPCDDNTDCPLGSACLVTGVCSRPCPSE
jgi:hypothetical protein